MASTKVQDTESQRIPEAISRSPSQVLTPVVKDGVSEIATMLVGIDDIVESISAELSPAAGNFPGMGGLSQEITELGKEVKNVKLAQDTQIKAFKDEVTKDAKGEIAQLVGEKIGSIIEDAIVVQVQKEMEEWNDINNITKFVGQLEKMVQDNDGLLVETRIHLENSRSRHANSTLDVQTDFNTRLGSIKRPDGHMSELFPISLRELFSYDAEQLVRLIREHGLRPLDKHSENLNRFLIYIGVSASVPEQSVDFVEEQLPAYASGDTTWTRDGGNPKGARRASSASHDAKQGANTSWYPWGS